MLILCDAAKVRLGLSFEGIGAGGYILQKIFLMDTRVPDVYKRSETSPVYYNTQERTSTTYKLTGARCDCAIVSLTAFCIEGDADADKIAFSLQVESRCAVSGILSTKKDTIGPVKFKIRIDPLL